MARLEIRGSALQHAAATAFADELAIADLNFAANSHDGRATSDLHAFKTVVIVIGVLRFCGDRAAIIWIVDDEVGVAADGDGALAGEEPEELCGAGAGGVHKAIQGDAAGFDAVGVEKIDAILDAGNAVGNTDEGIFAKKFLRGVEGAVIGADSVDGSVRQRIPEDGLIMLCAERRRHDVLHALDAGAFGEGFVEQQMGQNGFDMNFDAAGFGGEAATRAFSHERWTT